jgi:hypothetical protein
MLGDLKCVWILSQMCFVSKYLYKTVSSVTFMLNNEHWRNYTFHFLPIAFFMWNILELFQQGIVRLPPANRKHLSERSLTDLDLLIEIWLCFISESSICCHNEEIITVQKLLSTNIFLIYCHSACSWYIPEITNAVISWLPLYTLMMRIGIISSTFNLSGPQSVFVVLNLHNVYPH